MPGWVERGKAFLRLVARRNALRIKDLTSVLVSISYRRSGVVPTTRLPVNPVNQSRPACQHRNDKSIRSRSCALGALVVLILCASTAGSGVDDPSLVWPARVEPAITSSFGEWRPGHIHAGVDVKTWGRIGVPLQAVADGYVWRVRTSPWGYGKALYLVLADGRTAVYGHMDRFTPELEDLVWERQHSEGQYSVDIRLEEGEFPVKQGEMVGYSGDTGASAPHLHFELRDENNLPLNPLLDGLRINDSFPPVIRFLLVRPVGSASRVNGGVWVHRFGVRARGGREYELRGRPEVEGSVGISVAAYDCMDGVWNRFSPHRLVLEVDDHELFEVRYDRFSYRVSGLINLDRDYRYMVREGSRAHTLYRVPGNELPFYGDYAEGAGYLTELEPGLHRLRVTVADALGNETHLNGEILVNRPPVLRVSVGSDPAAPSIEGWAGDPDGDEIDLVLEALHMPDPPVRDAGSGERERRDTDLTKWELLPEDVLILSKEGFHVSRALLDSLSAEGGRIVRVRATDPWGRNTLGDPISLGYVAELDPGSLHLTVERYEGFFLLEAHPGNPVPGKVTFQVQQGESQPVTVTGVLGEDNRFEAVYPLKITRGKRIDIHALFEPVSGPMREASIPQQVTPVSASSSSVYESADRKFRLEFPEGTVFEDSFVQGSPAMEVDGTAEQGLVVLSREYRLGPEDILFRGQAEVSLVVDGLPEYIQRRQVGLYTHDGSTDYSRWFNLGGELEGDVLKTRVGGLGPFAALADTTPPELRLLSPRDGSRLRVGRPRIVFQIEDNASGFSEESQLVLRLNGTKVIARYDPQRDRLIYVPRDPLDSGDYWISLEAIDNVGNVGRISASFTVR